jgi:hypothetical protein
LNGFCESVAWAGCQHCLAYMYITPLSWSRATRLRILFPLLKKNNVHRILSSSIILQQVKYDISFKMSNYMHEFALINNGINWIVTTVIKQLPSTGLVAKRNPRSTARLCTICIDYRRDDTINSNPHPAGM